jgi:hypothetical protein
MIGYKLNSTSMKKILILSRRDTEELLAMNEAIKAVA